MTDHLSLEKRMLQRKVFVVLGLAVLSGMTFSLLASHSYGSTKFHTFFALCASAAGLTTWSLWLAQMAVGEATHRMEEKKEHQRIIRQIVHEIRNPLSCICSAAQLAVMQKDRDNLQDLLETVLSAAHDLETALREIEVIGGLAEPQLDYHQVDEVAETAISLAEREKQTSSVEYLIDIDPDLPLIYMDRDLITHALLNLLRNSVEAMPSGGTVTISAHRGKGYAHLTVEDTGNGIPRTIVDKVFEAYVSSKNRRGHGLGLFIVKEIVESVHQGRIRLETRENEGTTVHLYLPLRS